MRSKDLGLLVYCKGQSLKYHELPFDVQRDGIRIMIFITHTGFQVLLGFAEGSNCGAYLLALQELWALIIDQGAVPPKA